MHVQLPYQTASEKRKLTKSASEKDFHEKSIAVPIASQGGAAKVIFF